LNLARQIQLTLDFAFFDDLAVQPGIFQSETHVHRNPRKKLNIVMFERPGSVQQFEYTDNNAFAIDDRHAVNVVGPVAQQRIEAGIEAGVGVRVLDIHDLAGLRHRAGDSLPHGQTDLVLDVLGDNRSNLVALAIDDKNRATVDPDFVADDP